MEESTVDFYYDKLCATNNASSVLVNFYGALFDITPDTNLYGIFGKLAKIYGKNRVFLSLLNCASMEVDHKNIIGLISFFCRKRFEEETKISKPFDLTKLALDNESKLQKKIKEQ